MKKWRCLVCNYIHEGENPPDICPVCGASSDKFILVEDEVKEKKWRCLVCNYIHEGENPPDICPVCGASSDKFVLVEDDKEYEKLDKVLGEVETDVIVVGSGAAALTSAITSLSKGLEVVILEKAPVAGGTSARSGGRYWIPNNEEQKKAGIKDTREDGIKYMARYSYPNLFDPDKKNYGLEDNAYNLIETYYDTGPEVLKLFSDLGVFTSHMEYNWKGTPQLDYMDTLKENKMIRGRTLYPDTEKGVGITGYDYVQLMLDWVEKNNGDLRLSHRVVDLITDKEDEVVGVKVESLEGSQIFKARKGVIFGSGGFSHNKELMARFQYGPQYGGCATGTNTGDLVNIAEKYGIKLGNMQNAYRNQSLFEGYLDNPKGVNSIFYITGDSVLQVNKYGKRVMNEKRNYNDRGLSHFYWDSVKGEWTNSFLFLVMDERTASNWQGMSPLTPPGNLENIPYIIKGESLDELSENIKNRLKKLEDSTGRFKLDESFNENLKETIARFNKFAISGIDEDFHRGDSPYDNEFFTFPPLSPKMKKWSGEDSKNPSMYPLEGPYYAFILASGKLDTNGGPVINKDGQMIRYDNKPMKRLYGAGNCVASPGVAAYWGAGATLGSAMVFGYRAGNHISKLEDK